MSGKPDRSCLRSRLRSRLRRRTVGALALAALLAAACDRGSAAGAGAGEDAVPAATADDGGGGTVKSGPPPVATAPAPERLTVRVVARHPHDPAAFTQGLVWQDGKLWESTGLYGKSSLRRVDLESGRVEASVPLRPELFGEGLALVGDRLVQLTWQEGRALFWDRDALALRDEKVYAGEGWGLVWDGQRLIQSDGSSRLVYRDAETFAEQGSLQVTDRGNPVSLLNELEIADGALYANLWTTDEIVRIDPASGRVTARIDASALREEATASAAGAQIDVLNGIAWCPERHTFLLTGKMWPRVYEVVFVPVGG